MSELREKKSLYVGVFQVCVCLFVAGRIHHICERYAHHSVTMETPQTSEKRLRLFATDR